MSLYRRFVHWLARDEIATAYARGAAEQNAKQAVELAWQNGFAHGERIGAQHAFNLVTQSCDERFGMEVLPADVARAKLGLLH